MSEDPGSSDFTNPPSYPFTGSSPYMGKNDYFALMFTPEGMKPIVDPETRMCIGYIEARMSIGYDPTYKYGFFKYGFIYDFNGQEVEQYKRELTVEDINAMSPEELEEYDKFRHAVFDAEDHGMFGSQDNVWLMVATDGIVSEVPGIVRNVMGTRIVRQARVASKKASKTVVNGIVNRSPESVQRAHNLLKDRKAAIITSKLFGRRQGVPTKIEISKELLGARLTVFLKNRLKMEVSSFNIKFEIEAIKRMRDPNRRVPVDILIRAIKEGVPSPDQSNRAFGLMYKMYNIIVTREGVEEVKVLEVLFNERTGTIKHFLYQDEPKFWRSIASKERQYSNETIRKKPFIQDMDNFKEQLNKTKDLKIKIPPKIKK